MPDVPVVRKVYHWFYDKFRKQRDSQLYGLDLESAFIELLEHSPWSCSARSAGTAWPRA